MHITKGYKSRIRIKLFIMPIRNTGPYRADCTGDGERAGLDCQGCRTSCNLFRGIYVNLDNLWKSRPTAGGGDFLEFTTQKDATLTPFHMVFFIQFSLFHCNCFPLNLNFHFSLQRPFFQQIKISTCKSNTKFFYMKFSKT